MAKLIDIVVDVEGGPCAGPGLMREFGAVVYDPENDHKAWWYHGQGSTMAGPFTEWLSDVQDHFGGGHLIFWSDNPAYDWQHINWALHTEVGRNPFGYSARRIGDLYAGLIGNPRDTTSWKRWRRTPHDHNPVNDARGNCEALEKIFALAGKGDPYGPKNDS